jgi:hypothetical protein
METSEDPFPIENRSRTAHGDLLDPTDCNKTLGSGIAATYPSGRGGSGFLLVLRSQASG